MRSFCSGSMRANTTSGASSASWSWVSDMRRSVSPRTTRGSVVVTRPIWRAIATAVDG